MEYKPILDAIKAMLVADETANGLIGVYRVYEVEQGVYSTPVCVIGTSTKLTHTQSYASPASGVRPRLWGVLIAIQILGRGYPTQEQIIKEVEVLDATQAAVYTVLNADTKLSGAVTQSLVQSVHNVDLPGGEYFGHEITLEAEKKEG
jgi:hypothetical protein